VTISEVDALVEAKLLAPYRSPEAAGFIAEFKDPNGRRRAARSSTRRSKNFAKFSVCEWVCRIRACRQKTQRENRKMGRAPPGDGSALWLRLVALRIG